VLIGIDASRAVRVHPTGTENYSRHLIIHLARLRRNALRLYFPRRPPQSFYAELIGTASIEFRVIPFPRFWTHFRLSLEMATNPPDILFIPAHIIPLVHPQKTAVTIHDLGYRLYPHHHPLLDRLYLEVSTRYNAGVASAIIADSYATKEDLIRFYKTPSDKIKVIYPGVDPVFKPVRDARRIRKVKSHYGIESEYFLYLGTIQPRKNLKRLIEAFALFRKRTSASVELVIAGKQGWLARRAMPKVADGVRAIGYVAYEHLPALMSGARLFVFPSLYEGFGFPALEAQACDTPLICADTSSLPEVAGDGALYADPNAAEPQPG